MIVADTSAIIAVAFNEPVRESFLQRILKSWRVLVSTVSIVESRMVVHGRRGQRPVLLLEDLPGQSIFEHVAPDSMQATAAYSAFVAYGRDSGHPASLNFGDAFSDALAKVRNSPLLFKGDDVARTDIPVALT